MMKKFKLVSCLGIIALIVFMICGNAPAKTVLRMNHQFPAAAAGSKIDQWFVDEIKKATGGEIEIQIFWSNALGSAKENLTLLGAGAIDGPDTPILMGFRRPSDRREAFSVARRLAEASGGEVVAVNLVTPVDYRVELEFATPGRRTTVHVTPEGTEAERAWCEQVNHENENIEWADLRWAHRLVFRGAA